MVDYITFRKKNKPCFFSLGMINKYCVSRRPTRPSQIESNHIMLTYTNSYKLIQKFPRHRKEYFDDLSVPHNS